MGTEDLEHLLARMPAIAEAVNAFSSEAVQQQAFRALVATITADAQGSLDGAAAAPYEEEPAEGETPPTPSKAKKKSRKAQTLGTAASKATRARPRSRGGSVVGELNLRPSGKQAFRDFAADKSPTTHPGKITVAVYYLAHILELEAIETDHIFTCYRDVNWKLPGDLTNYLSVTSNRTGYIDTSDRTHIRITNPGINFVEHDLPKREAK